METLLIGRQYELAYADPVMDNSASGGAAFRHKAITGASISLIDFTDAIGSPALKRVAVHWRDIRGQRMMPSWTDIKPSAIVGQLAIVWSYKYERENDEFIGRLSGDRIVQVFGKNIRGLSLSEIHPSESLPLIFRLLKRVVSEPALQHFEGTVFNQLDRVGIGARILLPLSDDGVTADGILGATEYLLHGVDRNAYVEAAPDQERWFSLNSESSRLESLGQIAGDKTVSRLEIP